MAGFVMRGRRKTTIRFACRPIRLAFQIRAVATRAVIAVNLRAKRYLARVAGIGVADRSRWPEHPPGADRSSNDEGNKKQGG